MEGRRNWRVTEERGGKGREEAGTPRVGSHPMSEILKNTDYRTDLKGGGGNTDDLPRAANTLR